MALRQEQVIDKIEVLENGVIQIRVASRIYDDNVFLVETYKRTIAEPDSDSSKLPERVKKIADVIWTTKVIDDYKEEKRKQIAGIPKNIPVVGNQGGGIR